MKSSEPKLHPGAFADQSAIIAGGTGEVGIEVGDRLLASGLRSLALLGRNEERGTRAARELAGAYPEATVSFRSVDANEPDDVAETVAHLAAEFDGIDVLVNSLSGSFDPQICHEIPLAQLPQIVHEQMIGTLLMSRAVLPVMMAQEGGSIVNIASDAAKHATPGESAIGAGMAGIVMFSMTLAMEAKRSGVRVNAVTPSFIGATRRYETIKATEFGARLVSKLEKKAAGLGLATPEDIAHLVVFLASPLARRVTGQVVSPNGGISAG